MTLYFFCLRFTCDSTIAVMNSSNTRAKNIKHHYNLITDKNKIKMVTNFIELAATKSKTGPWGRAQLSIARSVRGKGSKYTKRRAVHRRVRKPRSATEKERQGRTTYKLNRKVPNETVYRKYLFYNWGEGDCSKDEVCKKFKISASDIVDISHYQIIDSSSIKHAVCIEDNGGDDITFICGKIDTTQAKEVIRGKKGYNEIRTSIELLKKSKDDQSRGKETSGVNTSYKLVGHRKDPLSNVNSEYSYKPGTEETDKNWLNDIYCDLAYKMERCARRLGNALYETGIYSYVQSSCKIPAVAKPKPIVAKSNQTLQKSNPPAKINEEKEFSGLGTALAIGQNYWSKAHRDRDFYFSVLSCISQSTHDTGKVLYYFIFPEYEIMIPMRTGDILLFNPKVTHSCSNPSTDDAYIFSSYVSKQTVLVKEATNMRESDELVKSVVDTVYESMKNVYATMR